MKTYTTQAEVEKDIKNGVLAIEDDVTFECSISIDASINARNINARNINARNINTRNINARNINTRNINTWNIIAEDITAGDINAWNITAGDINARNINARNINYFAFCCVYQTIKCTSIEARRDNSHAPICLNGELEIKAKEETIEINGKKYNKEQVESRLAELKEII